MLVRVAKNVGLRAASTSSKVSDRIHNVAVIGAGQMGSGIAQSAAHGGMHVTLIDPDQASLEIAEENITKYVRSVLRKKYPDWPEAIEDFHKRVMGRMVFSTDMEAGVKKAEIIQESAPEKLEVKQVLYKELDAMAPEYAIFCSNTSAIKLSEIAQGLSKERQEKFAGLHFHTPVPMQRMCECVEVQGYTSEETIETIMEFTKRLGKVGVRCDDHVGYIVDRLRIPYLFEAMRLHERGHGSMFDIDVAMKLGANYKLGPFELCDHIGLDNVKNMMDGWREAEPDNPLYAPVPTLERLVSEGKFGKKTGQGFFRYKEKRAGWAKR